MSQPTEFSTVLTDSVAEHSFLVHRGEHTVPAVLWRRAEPIGGQADPLPRLVLLGHGGSAHKRSDRVLARWLVIEAGLAAVAIDGPYHGDRVPAYLTAREYQARIAAEGAANVVERMISDWAATVEAVGNFGLADTDTLGYFGLSMGTRYGLPLAAALGDRVRCAVFGKFGLEQSSSLPAGLDTSHVTREAASAVSARTLFHVQVGRRSVLARGPVRTLRFARLQGEAVDRFPGRHAESNEDAVSAWRRFLAGVSAKPTLR